MSDIRSEYEILMRNVESGALGVGNLVQMIVDERVAHHATGLALKEWQILANTPRPCNYHILAGINEQELIELILWMALPWGNNDPNFPESDGWTPRALNANTRMARTWQRVVRGRDLATPGGAVPTSEVVEKGEANGLEGNSSKEATGATGLTSS